MADYRGLLDLTDEDKSGALNMGLLQAGLGILARNTNRDNPMQAIGLGGMQGLQGYQQALDRAQKEKLLKLEKQKILRELQNQQKMDEFQKKVQSGAFNISPATQAMANGKGPTPENAAAMAGLKPKIDRSALYGEMLGVPGLMPAGLSGMQTMEENALKRQEHKDLLDVKIAEAREARDQRAADALERLKMQLDSREQIAQMTKAVSAAGRSPYYQFLPTAEGYMAGNARTGAVAPAMFNGKQVIPAAADPSLQGKLAGAKAGGKVVGEDTATAKISLPEAKYTLNRAINHVNELLKHPGFQDYVGATWKPGFRFIEGSNAANFESRFKQLEGGVFMDAYKTLKGGGQITEIEGEKATVAKSRMQKSTSEKEFQDAAKDFVGAIKAGLTIMENKAKMKPAQNRRASDVPGAVIDFSELPQ